MENIKIKLYPFNSIAINTMITDLELSLVDGKSSYDVYYELKNNKANDLVDLYNLYYEAIASQYN